jgi:translation initiation factor 2 beta subunit (eIF-2beta)/eIF-5
MPTFVDPSACKHLRTQLIARDEETEYLECLDCGEIIEPTAEQPAKANFDEARGDESLSDA